MGRWAVAFVVGWAQTSGGNNLMSELLLTNAKGKRHSTLLVSASNNQRPNEIQMRELEQINRRLPPQILAEMSTRGLAIPPREFGLLLSHLKAPELNISIRD